MVSRHGEKREQRVKRTQTRRDQPVGSTDISGRGLEQKAPPNVSWGIWLCIGLQALVIAGFVTAVVWGFLGMFVYKVFVPVFGLDAALQLKAWFIDLSCVVLCIVLFVLWCGPAKRLGPMYFYVPSSIVSRPSSSNSGIKGGPSNDELTSTPAQGKLGENFVVPTNGENDAEREYNEIYRHYRQDESVICDVPEFPAAGQYRQMSKACILERLAYALRHHSRLQRALETVQTETNSLALSAGFEHPPLATFGTGSGPPLLPPGFDGPSPEVENICSNVNAFRRPFQRIIEQVEIEKGKTAAVKEKMQKIQEELREENRRLRNLKLHAEVSEARSRKREEETGKEYENLPAELIRLKGKVWIFIRLRPRVDTDQENQYIDLTSPDGVNRSVVLRGDIDPRYPQDTYYNFDRVFHHVDTNRDLYKYVRPMVQIAMEGCDVAIILEGPSGSGKSYTMFDQPDGIAFSIARHVLQSPTEGGKPTGPKEIRIASFKVYKEKILDATISKGENPPLHIKEVRGSKIQVYRDRRYTSRVDGKLVSTTEGLTSEFIRMLKAREQRETAQNATSSRGHSICKLEFSASDGSTGETKTSTLFLVDLAGPESFKQSTTPEETKAIIQGRTELQHRLCEMIEIHQLDTKSEKRKTKTRELRRQLKNSKLTHILQDCFLGEPTILVIGTVNPYAAVEHRSRIRETFEFASKIRNLGAHQGHLKAIPNTP